MWRSGHLSELLRKKLEGMSWAGGRTERGRKGERERRERQKQRRERQIALLLLLLFNSVDFGDLLIKICISKLSSGKKMVIDSERKVTLF